MAGAAAREALLAPGSSRRMTGGACGYPASRWLWPVWWWAAVVWFGGGLVGSLRAAFYRLRVYRPLELEASVAGATG